MNNLSHFSQRSLGFNEFPDDLDRGVDLANEGAVVRECIYASRM